MRLLKDGCKSNEDRASIKRLKITAGWVVWGYKKGKNAQK